LHQNRTVSSSATKSDTASAASSRFAKLNATSVQKKVTVKSTSLKASNQVLNAINPVVNVTITANDGSTMKNGDSKNLSGQNVQVNAINLAFTLTQDGTLKSGSTIKIPVTITNNSSSNPGSALSSGTALNIQNVGTITYVSNDQYGANGYYLITIGDDFEKTVGKTVTATVTEKPSVTGSLTAKNSYQNVIVSIR